jgi:hypothetical protein
MTPHPMWCPPRQAHQVIPAFRADQIIGRAKKFWHGDVPYWSGGTNRLPGLEFWWNRN